MLDDLIKGVVLGIIMWLSLFAAGAVVFAIGMGTFIGIIMLFVEPAVSIPIAWYYLKDQDIADKLSEGMRLGIFWAILSILLDTTIYAFLLGRGMTYLLAWTLWLGYAEMILFSAAVGYYLMRRKKRW